MQSPALIVVNGQPATGKTTIALRLAERLRIPCFRKDVYKEAAYDVFGSVTPEQNALFGRLAMKLLFLDAEQVLRAGGQCIVEANFAADIASSDYQKLIHEVGARGCQVFVSAPAEVLLERFVARAQSAERHPGHGDAAPGKVDEWRERFSRPFLPLDLSLPLIAVDTTDFATVVFPDVLARVRETL